MLTASVVLQHSDVFMLRRQETALHTALRLTGDLPQDHEVFLLRPTHQSPTSWAAALRCFRGLGGGGLLSAGHSSAASCSGNVALLLGAIEEHLVKLRDEINAQYIMERLLPGRDPVCAHAWTQLVAFAQSPLAAVLAHLQRDV